MSKKTEQDLRDKANKLADQAYAAHQAGKGREADELATRATSASRQAWNVRHQAQADDR